MRKSVFFLAIAGFAALIFTGCSSPSMTGPERKFGRGVSNITEFARLGEIRRSMEQTGVFHGPGHSPSAFIHGFNRSISRTMVGAYEMVTFPIPNGRGKDYGPLILPETPVYPDNYKPGLLDDTMYATDTNLGMSGGDFMPHFPGSRFKVFDN
jgi:putative exosortase-associated protein (TIGR04073 family)